MSELSRRAFTVGLGASVLAAATRARGADGGAPGPRLEGAALDALLAEVARARSGLKSLRATFTQERRIRLLATSVTSQGAVTYVAPDRLRWELSAPDDVVYWVSPEGLSYRTRSSKGTMPAGAANVARTLADVRAMLTGDLSALRQRYDLSAARGGGGEVLLEGTAHDPGANVRAFTLTIDKGLVLPVRARLIEGKRDTIDLVFADAKVDAPVDPASMKP